MIAGSRAVLEMSLARAQTGPTSLHLEVTSAPNDSFIALTPARQQAVLLIRAGRRTCSAQQGATGPLAWDTRSRIPATVTSCLPCSSGYGAPCAAGGPTTRRSAGEDSILRPPVGLSGLADPATHVLVSLFC